MTHKIKVQMFGNFRMDYNGAPFVAEKMHKESQFNRMMQALIHYSDCGIAKDKLEEIVIGERDIDAPHTALSIMYGDTWQVRWKEFLSDSYVYGSKIEFNEDGSVSYKNRLMPPGTVIHTWYSMTNFQGNRIEPSLPLIDGERAYSIAVNIDYHNSESEALMLRIIFFDRYDAQAQSIIVRDKKAFFKPSIRTYSYRIELINGGNADFTFKSLVIKEVSEEEFDAEQERIERLKEESNKSKKKRRKNKKSK